ncbi:MAG: energy transducer TonB [Helicobacteraceae bacterium]|jgi:TonB family protein|nr:energy transducer TonB [Helicobacteraceae bacterium]
MRNLLSFLTAAIIYLPLMLLFLWANRQFAVEPIRYVALPLGFFIDETIALPSASENPLQPATQNAVGEEVQVSDPSLEDSPGSVSVNDLNRVFEPMTTTNATELTIPASELGELYGTMLLSLTAGEREFLEENLNPIQVITQRYLTMRGYPRLAVQKNMTGDAIVSFTLYPNGDITPIEKLRSTGWSLLDDHAIETIKSAYKDYPHPKEPVRVRMRVLFRLF